LVLGGGEKNSSRGRIRDTPGSFFGAGEKGGRFFFERRLFVKIKKGRAGAAVGMDDWKRKKRKWLRGGKFFPSLRERKNLAITCGKMNSFTSTGQ